MNRDLCFWTVADGVYGDMARALVASYRACGMEYDFHVFGDCEVAGAISHRVPVPDESRWGCFFKFVFLRKYVSELPYRYYAYLDSDNFFVRKPRDVLGLMHGSPVHAFLENDCTRPDNRRKDWWGCPLDVYVSIMRELGVLSRKVYNVNGGFFVVQREVVLTFLELGAQFLEHTQKRGYKFVDEPPLAYITHMLCGDAEYHTLACNEDVWASEWTGAYRGRLPDGHPWSQEDYMLGTRKLVNPAIVHAMRSKDALIEYGKQRT